MKKYKEDEIQGKLSSLTGWTFADEGIEKEFKLADFKSAFAVMTRIAFEAEAMNHHPEWFNVYNTLKIRLSTHDAGGVTDKDFSLAERVEAIIQEAS
jgi:4a-hydroxytetrahydrobiopterin dehydratase